LLWAEPVSVTFSGPASGAKGDTSSGAANATARYPSPAACARAHTGTSGSAPRSTASYVIATSLSLSRTTGVRSASDQLKARTVSAKHSSGVDGAKTGTV